MEIPAFIKAIAHTFRYSLSIGQILQKRGNEITSSFIGLSENGQRICTLVYSCESGTIRFEPSQPSTTVYVQPKFQAYLEDMLGQLGHKEWMPNLNGPNAPEPLQELYEFCSRYA